MKLTITDNSSNPAFGSVFTWTTNDSRDHSTSIDFRCEHELEALDCYYHQDSFKDCSCVKEYYCLNCNAVIDNDELDDEEIDE